MGGAGSKTRARPRGRSSTLADRPTPPGKPLLVPCDKHSPEPDVVTIRWEPPLYDGGSWITGYLVEHRRTGSPHWVRSWPQLVRETELTLSGLEPGWRYQFRVSAQNVVGLSDPGELSDLLTVTLQRTAASAPFFVKELHDTNALENEKAELSVQVRGTPTPTVSWFKDGVEVFSSRSYRVITDNEISTLVIHQAALSDEGEIKCAATNRVGYTFSRAKLIIQAPPNIRLPRQYEEGLLFEKDEVIRLKVSVAGRPVPEVTWALNGEPVPGGGRYEAAHSERYATLRVGEARRSDRGEYTVRAVNPLGEDTASFLVTVADKPQPPGRAKVVMTLGRSVTLSWTSPEDDGGCKIGNYIVEYYRLGWNMWLKAATCRQLTTTLGELIEGSQYKFRVKAENPYGVSEPSSESDVVFIPDPKRGLLEPPDQCSVNAEEMDVWLEDKKRPMSTSPTIDEQYGERKTKKKRGPMAPPQERQTDKHSMMSEDSMSPPVTPDRLKPTIPRRRPRIERSEVAMEALEEKELTKKLDERRRVEEFKKFEEIKKAEELRKVEEQRREEEKKQNEEKRVADIKKKKELQQTPQMPRMKRDSVHGSSELMLVLLPHSRATTEEREASKRKLFESSLALQDEIAPPMSLSAPELGCGEPPEEPLMRSAFSSTELLHDRAMARFYQDQEREEAESSLRRRGSLQRRASLERRLSRTKASSLQDIFSVTKPIKEEEEEEAKLERPASTERKSPRLEIVRGVLSGERVEANMPNEKHDRKTFSRESMDSVISTDDVPRKHLVQQTSEEDMEYEISSTDEEEEDEYDEDEEEPITDDVMDEELEDEFEEEEEEEDLSTYDKKEYSYTSESEEDALYSYSLEEDTYLPTTINMKYDEDTMISAYEGRGPLILGSQNKPSTSSTVPKYSPLEDLLTEAISSNGEAKLKPILKRPSADIVDTVINERVERRSSPTNYEESKIKTMAAPEKRFEPNFNPTIPKPILKVRELSQEKQTPVALRIETELDQNRQSPSKTNLEELSDYESGSKKKQVRIEEPEETKLTLEKKENNTRLAKTERQQSDSQGEEIDGSRVLISHYSDIVAEYSRTKKRPKVPLYLDYESLKAAAEKEEEILPPVIPEITVDEPMPEPELEPHVESEPEQNLHKEPEPEALFQVEPKPELDTKPDDTEEPVKLQRHTVHFEPVADENSYSPKPTEKVRGKPPSILKKRDPSPMKKRSSSPRKKSTSAVDDYSEVSNFRIKIEPVRTPSPVLPIRPYNNTERKVHSFFDFMMDLSLFILACWLYLFKDERLAIPVLCLMIYRQARDAFLRKMEALRNKLPRRILFWKKD